ncbi:primosomal protein DnaI [Pediococcus inopinatus]|uniref:Primosomal protein DnaI n=1 Tax=Pediococcus inopinatus TaxID=114090 RepID=A0ABZ0Q651_9LACO|nr:primosomal protein DnaI [Pediococcus inopinatus]WPC17476.1 primosomal protein DnaI [Pediococcus inopinatus]WPC18846.1 primosomal protein DnaI [Pediococcus inopinatus]WPC22463.1 primosomal protein DnaI [Pediococcus inopinatus]WPP08604.1 primosomal protein DnaI [Pediococcus inopinatus]
MENIREVLKELMSKRQLDTKFQDLMTPVYEDADVLKFCEEHKNELSTDGVARSASKLYEYVQERDKYNRNEPTLMPGYQPILIVNNHMIEVSYQPSKKLLANEKQRAFNMRVKAVNMPKMIRRARFDDFFPDQDRQTALTAALNFIQAYEKDPHQFHKGLYLTGSFGVGKTYLLGAIANELATQGYESTLVHFPSFAVEMKNAIGENNLAEKLNLVKKAPILMLDDVGADAMSSWVRDEVLGVILEYRMQNELPTFFSSNFSMTQLETEHLQINQRGESEPLKAKRLMERIKFLATEVTMVGVNRRQK